MNDTQRSRIDSRKVGNPQTGEPETSPPQKDPDEQQSLSEKACLAVSARFKHFCCRKGVVGAATQELAVEDLSLLRVRLIAVSFVSLLGYTLFFLRSLAVDRTFLWLQTIPLIILTISLILLRTRDELSQRKLRLMELVIFGTGLAYLLLIHCLAVVASAEKGEAVLTSVGINQLFMSCFALIVIYGMFIPNTWQRALVVITPMLVLPAILGGYLWWAQPVVRQVTANTAVTRQFSYLVLLLVMGTLFSVLAAHIIHSIRQTAAREKEMGRYRLEERIGSGGMGEVWRAEHHLLARPAAIKMIRPHMLVSRNGEDSATAKRRFEREAKATASLRSPHTVELYDFGITESGVFYYVMEYLEGLDLDTLVERFGPLPAERAVYLLLQAIDSLAEAHEKGLIHRDLKPSNLHVGQVGLQNDFLKVLDFGLVKVQHQAEAVSTRLTQEGSTTGTPAFMAPELALHNREIDERSDIYSLGCVAYWLLTGRLVFESDTAMQMIVDHARTAPVAPSKISETDVPEELDQIVLACLEKDPEKRPRNMQELGQMMAACEAAGQWTQQKAFLWWQKHHPRPTA